MLDPEFDRHFAMRDRSPFWQGGPDSGRVAMAPGFQATSLRLFLEYVEFQVGDPDFRVFSLWICLRLPGFQDSKVTTRSGPPMF